MTVRCQLLVLLFLVSSVVSGPTRSAAESSNGTTTISVTPSQAMTSSSLKTPTAAAAATTVPVAEPPVSIETTVAPQPQPALEITTTAEPAVVAKISLTESSSDPAVSPTPPPPPEGVSSAPLEVTARQMSSEDSATEKQERCTESAPGVTEPGTSATDSCGSTGNTNSDQNGGSDGGCVVDDHDYPDGARVPGPQDPCRPCFCHRKRVTCVELRCYTRRGCKPLFKAGVCCPTYDHCPPAAMMNATGEVVKSQGSNEDPGDAGAESVTKDQVPAETMAGLVAHLVDSSVHKEDDSEDESKSGHEQDDDDGDDHDHSHHHYRKHHMIDPLTSSATTIRPGTSFPFLVRGRAGVEVR